ncbi:DUF5819 family protein [Streptomyces sp. NPDC056399]|uniref:DUF5819 family protein n=1 Tax=Streptomyces sp. NPDC056399 TaxID=3345807 RepID=UPI0035D7269A
MDAYVEKGAADADDGRPTPPAGTGHQGPSDPVTTEPSEPSEPSDLSGQPEPSGLSGDGSDVRPAAERAGGGIMALSMPYQVVLAVALAVVGVFACVHLAMVFLHVAPSNTLTKRHGQAVDDWVYPEFEQNWKLFAPNPLQQNVSVEVRAELVAADGSRRTTGWTDLTAQDAEAIRHNPMPSHAQQNELRRAVDFYLNSHSEDHTPNGMRGRLSEEYMRRIAMLRLGDRSGDAERVQLRTVTRAVAAPAWGSEKNDTTPSYRDFPWWPVTDADRPAGVDRSRTEAGR